MFDVVLKDVLYALCAICTEKWHNIEKWAFMKWLKGDFKE